MKRSATCSPVKIQQRTSGGCWRTLQGLADFAIVQSYLDTATKWGLDKYSRPPPTLTSGPGAATTHTRTQLNSLQCCDVFETSRKSSYLLHEHGSVAHATGNPSVRAWSG